MNNLVSIIVPIYNVEQFLSDCLTSIVNQTYENLEIILVDDGSSDSSGKICDKFAAIDNRIRVAHNSNHGVSYSRNYGLNLCTGEYVMFVDSDDTVEKNYVYECVEAARDNDVDVVICGVNDIYVRTGIIKKRIFPTGLTGFIKDDYTILYYVPSMSSVWGKLYDLKIIKDHSIKFREDIHISEDHIFNCDYFKRVTKYFCVRESLYNYFHRERISLSKTYTLKTFKSAIQGCKITKDFLSKKKVLDRDKILASMAMGSVRRFAFLSDGDFSYKSFRNRMEDFRSIICDLNDVPVRVSHRFRMYLIMNKYYLPLYIFYYFRLNLCKK